MLRRITYYLFLIIYLVSHMSYFLFLIPPNSVSAQTTPIANCDLCGYCNGGTAPSTWEKCVRCIYPDLAPGGVAPDPLTNTTLINVPVPNPDKYYTMLGCLSTDPAVFTTQIAQVIFSLIGGIAFLYLIYGAGVLITSRSDPDKLSQGKRIVFSALAGLLFVLFSTFIIRFIAVNMLRAPGFSDSTTLPTATPTP
jgi:hypothetical protein